MHTGSIMGNWDNWTEGIVEEKKRKSVEGRRKSERS
jgi:hypothetical protein